LFGANNDVRVMRLKIQDREALGVKKAWHGTSLSKTMLYSKSFRLLIDGQELFIKQVGPFDPIDLGFEES
jgi:hypothetical protein